jgi:thiamine kinase
MDPSLPPASTQLIPPALLARVPGCEDGRPPVDCRVLQGGGALNRCHLVVTREGRFVLRRRVDTAPRPGADGSKELACQRAAAAAGLAPLIMDAAADASWVLMEYVAGGMWQRTDLADKKRVEALGLRLAELHAIVPPPVAPLNAMRIANGQIAMILAQDPTAREELGRDAATVARLVEECRALSQGPVLNHGDVNVANLLGAQPVLVDWEYAQLADPLYDVACLLVYYPELRRWLDWFIGPAGQDAATRHRLLEAQLGLFAVLNRLWGRAQGALHGDAAGLVPGRSAE